MRRRALGNALFSIRLDHGDVLVMDGSAQSEYEHRFTLGGGIVTVVSVHPARQCTSPLEVVPVGSEDGVGDCHDVANFIGKCLFISFYIFLEKNLCSFYKGMDSYFCILLSMLVAKREPTPCYRDAYSVGTPKWAYWGRGWQIHCKATISTLYGRLFSG